MISTGLTVGLVLLAAREDLRSRTIPNRLTLGMALVGLTQGALLGGWGGAQYAALGWLIGLSILLPPFLLGWLGAGDLKLLAAVGALEGPQLALFAGSYGMAAGGVLALVVLLRRTGRPGRDATAVPPWKISLPYGPALAFGTLLALALG